MNSKKVLDSINYIFDPENNEIRFLINIQKKDILLITNLTLNKLIYNFACETEGGSFESNTLTFVTSNVGMSSTDELMIILVSEDKVETYLRDIYRKISDTSELMESLLLVNTQDSILGDMIVNAINKINPPDQKYEHITTATTTVVKIGEGHLGRIIVNNPTNDVITIYDGLDTTRGKVIAIIDFDVNTLPQSLAYDLKFTSGLIIVTAGTPDITAIYI